VNVDACRSAPFENAPDQIDDGRFGRHRTPGRQVAGPHPIDVRVAQHGAPHFHAGLSSFLTQPFISLF